MPGAYQAVYNGTKAFLDSVLLRIARRARDTRITVTCLMPGARRPNSSVGPDMLDTAVGTQKKDDPADVAATGFEAMMAGEGGVVSGMKNKLTVAAAHGTVRRSHFR